MEGRYGVQQKSSTESARAIQHQNEMDTSAQSSCAREHFEPSEYTRGRQVHYAATLETLDKDLDEGQMTHSLLHDPYSDGKGRKIQNGNCKLAICKLHSRMDKDALNYHLPR